MDFLKFGKEHVVRLKHASFSEVAYRLKRSATRRSLKRRLQNGGSPLSVPEVNQSEIDSLKMPGFVFNAENLPVHGYDPSEVNIFEKKWQNSFFSDVKSEAGDPDIRTVWEKGRLQQASIKLINPDAEKFEKQAGKKAVLDWLQNNPFLQGPHFMSAMECGLRIPVFFYCLKNGLHLCDEEKNILLRAIYEHGWWIERNLSLYASNGNHTICESIGLIFAGAVFRNHSDGRRWMRSAHRLLDIELIHQVLEDGGPVEQSLAYHRFVLDLYWLAYWFLIENQLHNCINWKVKLEAGEAFLKAFSVTEHQYPSIGDSDDGYAVAPGVAPIRSKERTVTDPVNTFTESGYTVIRGEAGIVLTFDHGPLGMAPLYNHGHADALSITLSVGGMQIFVDPGTYRYNNVPEWRRYFKSTRAHNTVTIDGYDQAVQETGFIWGKPYEASLIRKQTGDNWIQLQASHDGYKRLRDSVVHSRTLFVEDDKIILIRDSFEGQEIYDFELNFHLHPEAVAAEIDGWIKITAGDERIFLSLVEGGNFGIIHASGMPIHGWYSPAYGVKVPTTVLSCRMRQPALDAQFLTAVSLSEPCNLDGLTDRISKIERQASNS
jgi:hypothetical protein